MKRGEGAGQNNMSSEDKLLLFRLVKIMNTSDQQDKQVEHSGRCAGLNSNSWIEHFHLQEH